jgi:hypothetical protein
VFVAYRALEGQPFSDAALNALSPPARARALDELAALLDAIHAVPVATARTAGVSFALHKGAYHAAQENLERELSQLFGPGELDAIARQRLLDWGDVSLGHADFDLAIIGAFCGPHTLQGLLDRLAKADAERALASIPFLLTVRWLQDALYDISRGDEPSLRRLHEHIGSVTPPPPRRLAPAGRRGGPCAS